MKLAKLHLLLQSRGKTSARVCMCEEDQSGLASPQIPHSWERVLYPSLREYYLSQAAPKQYPPHAGITVAMY